MLPQNRDANTQAKPRAATGTLCRVERIEYLRNRVRRDSRAVVLNRNHYFLRCACCANLNPSRFADFTNCLLGVDYQIQKNLNQLARIANDSGQILLWLKADFDRISPQRMLVKLKRAFDNVIQIDWFF